MAEGTEIQGNREAAAKVTGHFRPFLHRTRYKVPTSVSALGERLVGSNSNLSILSGSAHNLLDPSKMMSLQEDARSRKISSEVMKRCLYKSAAAPCRRRIMNRMSCSITPHGSSTPSTNFHSRKMLSLPVTPMQSLRVTPSGSPTEDRHFFYGFLSHGPTPRSTTPVPFDDDDEMKNARSDEDEDDDERDCKGLASLFRPQPHCVVARVWSQQDCDEFPKSGGIESQDSASGALPSLSRYRSPNSIIKRKGINMKTAAPI